MKLNEIILFGYSGHALVVNDCLPDGHTVYGYFDLKENETNPLNLHYLGDENDANLSELRDNFFVFPAVGENKLRKKFRKLFLDNDLSETNAVHQTAAVSQKASIGLSTMVGPNAIVNSFAVIGDGVIINSGAVIEHECIIEDYVHVAPGATLAGNVTVGEGSFIGANSVVKEGVKIGRNVIIGAGAVVLSDIPDNELWIGGPAKKKRDIEK